MPPFSFPWPNPHPQSPQPSAEPKPSFRIPFSPLQTHLTSFLSHVSPLTAQLESAFQRLLSHSPEARQLSLSKSTSAPPLATPLWARVGAHRFDIAALPAPDVEERLAGVPVYTLSNAADEFVLVSGIKTGKSLGLLCFKEEDAESLLQHMKSMDGYVGEGSKVVAVALNKVFQLKVRGVAFRFIPDSSQVTKAIEERRKAGDNSNEFSGVPVFQSRSLILRSGNKKYRPVFFRKEDLDDALYRSSQHQRQLNPALRKGDIEVCVLEEAIRSMKEKSLSKWDNAVFIPPGFNVSTDLSTTTSA